MGIADLLLWPCLLCYYSHHRPVILVEDNSKAALMAGGRQHWQADDCGGWQRATDGGEQRTSAAGGERLQQGRVVWVSLLS